MFDISADRLANNKSPAGRFTSRFSNRADAVRYLDELVVRFEGRRSRDELDERWWICEARLVTRYTVCARNHG